MHCFESNTGRAITKERYGVRYRLNSCLLRFSFTSETDMKDAPSLEIDLIGSDSAFCIDEATFNPFILSYERVDVWFELVIRNGSDSLLPPPTIQLRFNTPVQLGLRPLERVLPVTKLATG